MYNLHSRKVNRLVSLTTYVPVLKYTYLQKFYVKAVICLIINYPIVSICGN